MSLEGWKAIADWSTIVLIALTVVSGSAALILGDRINEKQAKQLEEERRTRLELQASLAPRDVNVSPDDQKRWDAFFAKIAELKNVLAQPEMER